MLLPPSNYNENLKQTKDFLNLASTKMDIDKIRLVPNWKELHIGSLLGVFCEANNHYCLRTVVKQEIDVDGIPTSNFSVCYDDNKIITTNLANSRFCFVEGDIYVHQIMQLLFIPSNIGDKNKKLMKQFTTLILNEIQFFQFNNRTSGKLYHSGKTIYLRPSSHFEHNSVVS